MALEVKCDKGHSYIQPDIVVGNLPEGMPACPTCREEWLKRQAPDPDDKLTPQQRAYCEATSRKDLIVLQGGRATGKTYAAMHAVFAHCELERNCVVFYWAPMPECEYTFRQWAKHPDVESVDRLSRTLDLGMGNKVVFASDPNYARSLMPDWLIVDYYGSIPIFPPTLKRIGRVTLILGEDWEVIKMPEVENPHLEAEPEAEVG